jgi:hypothetical protein
MKYIPVCFKFLKPLTHQVTKLSHRSAESLQMFKAITLQLESWPYHPVTMAYKHQILTVSFLLLDNEPIRGSHFFSFLHILPLKQYKG